MEEVVIDVLPDGTQEMLLQPEMCELLAGEILDRVRVSNIDLDENGAWWAVVIDGKVLGPHRTRAAAILDEIDYIHANMTAVAHLAEDYFNSPDAGGYSSVPGQLG